LLSIFSYLPPIAQWTDYLGISSGVSVSTAFVHNPTSTHPTSDAMYVRKRGMYAPDRANRIRDADFVSDGRQERVQFDKITARVSRLCYGLDVDHVDPVAITQKVISGVYGGVTTAQLDDLVSLARSRPPLCP
jgi:hypothetical protein